jgi:hypothetical protein
MIIVARRQDAEQKPKLIGKVSAPKLRSRLSGVARFGA